jgi:chromate transporter
MKKTTTVSFREAFKVWLKVAAYSFGGPAGQISVMHQLVVEEKKWVSERRFLHALNYAMLLPGPEAQQLATYLGWLLHGIPGGLMAGILFIIPGFISILLLSVLYAGYQEVTLVQALFYGLKPAVLAVVATAVLNIGRRALPNHFLQLIAATAFIAIFFFNIPFPFIILAAGLLGYFGSRRWPSLFLVRPQNRSQEKEEEDDRVVGDTAVSSTNTPRWQRSLAILLTCLLLWFLPILFLANALGRDHILVQQGLFFSRVAVVTFGGAYAVLAYVAQEAVQTYGWLLPGEMLDGLGMAETTPGPLIQVVQFVGFMGAYRFPEPFSPLMAGLLGAIITTWVTFVPCFLWIFLGAPYIEQLRDHKTLNAALTSITAAVVGVILNLAIWFALHTLFSDITELYYGPLRLFVPDWSTLDPVALLIAVGSFIALFRLRWGIFRTLTISMVVGILYYWLFL